jgi:hypothetical protein
VGRRANRRNSVEGAEGRVEALGNIGKVEMSPGSGSWWRYSRGRVLRPVILDPSQAITDRKRLHANPASL